MSRGDLHATIAALGESFAGQLARVILGMQVDELDACDPGPPVRRKRRRKLAGDRLLDSLTEQPATAASKPKHRNAKRGAAAARPATRPSAGPFVIEDGLGNELHRFGTRAAAEVFMRRSADAVRLFELLEDGERCLLRVKPETDDDLENDGSEEE